ncbi:MAG: 3-hydroxyacyl-ACP dehydratase FabZ family protein [Tepidisphaeraceae bacterium]
MKFELLDKIESLDDKKIVASKTVSAAEEYLADHFPSFPVLPGVMMLEALTQAASWLLQRRRQFARTMVVLKEARNVRYGTFVAPGDTLKVEVEFVKDVAPNGGATFKAVGTVNGEQALSARLELAYFSLADHSPELAELDKKIAQHTQSRWTVLGRTLQNAEATSLSL